MTDPVTAEDAVRIVEAYEALVDRAVEIAKAPPFNAGIDMWHDNASSYARLVFQDGRAILQWPCATTYGDDADLRDRDTSFPIGLLFLPDDKLAECMARAREEQEARERAESERYRQENEARERSALAALMAKYLPDLPAA